MSLSLDALCALAVQSPRRQADTQQLARGLAALHFFPPPLPPDARRLGHYTDRDAIWSTRLTSLSLCSYPCLDHPMLRYLPADELPEEVRDTFARPIPGLPGLAAVFIHPEERNYRSFENILPLDVLFEGCPLALALEDRQPIGGLPDAWRFRVRTDDATHTLLSRLDGFDLYQPPEDPDARGGGRLIFHAAALSRALGDAARSALPAAAREGLLGANTVLRCNSFEPGGTGFHTHHDTPYADTAAAQVSRYTLLVYLTGGTGAPVLQLGDTAIEAVEPMTAIIFHHRHAHQSAPYTEGPKVFLRTELVYDAPELDTDPELGVLFAQACYLTGYPEQAEAMRARFDAVAARRWGLESAALPKAPLFAKLYQTIPFACDGHDYWFAPGRALKDCAVLAIMDHFNVHILEHVLFRWNLTETTLASHGDIPGFLAQDTGEPLLSVLSLERLMPPPEQHDRNRCCPDHDGDNFDPTRSKTISDLYNEKKAAVDATLGGVSILLMDEHIFLSPDAIVIGEEHIYVLADKALAPVNFAGGWSPPCWTDSDEENYLGVECTLRGLHLVTPPIRYTVLADRICLSLDHFQSRWISHHTSTDDAEIPRIKLSPA